jgi:hypothetical protein
MKTKRSIPGAVFAPFAVIFAFAAVLIAVAAWGGGGGGGGGGASGGGGTGFVYIGMGGARTMTPGPAELGGMSYKAVFTGPGGTVNRDFGASGGTVELAAGTWRVSVKARNSANRLRGMYDGTLAITPGNTHTVEIASCIGITSEADLHAALSPAGLNDGAITYTHDTVHGDYLVLLNDISITTAISANTTGTYTLAGSGTIRLAAAGFSMLTINSGVRFTLDGPTLAGLNPSGFPLVNVSGGAFILKNGNITGNTNNTNNGGGVVVNANGTFTMNGGSITYNTANPSGGGVALNSGTFTMNGGNIGHNTATGTSVYLGGGGVYAANAAFVMNGGSISGNAANAGGGVYVPSGGSFTMNGGSISGNTAQVPGGGSGGGAGGVFFEGQSFTIAGGGITNNHAPFSSNAGGFYIASFDTGGSGIFSHNARQVISGNTNNGAPGSYPDCSFNTTVTPPLAGSITNWPVSGASGW